MPDNFRSGVRFFFEITMPGVFLLCNCVLFYVMLLIAWYNPSESQLQQAATAVLQEGGIVMLIVVIAFSYGLGTVLRLLKVSWVDRMAGEWLYHFTDEGQNDYAAKPFFYFEWMKGKVTPDRDAPGVTRLPKSTSWVIETIWGPHYCPPSATPIVGKLSFFCRLLLPKLLSNQLLPLIRQGNDVKHAFDDIQRCSSRNTAIINWCKIVLNKCDSRSATEAFEAEWTLRYVAGMVYALRASIWLVVVGIVFLLLSFFITFFVYGSSVFQLVFALSSILLVIAYGCLMILILRHLRYLRCKEVETLLGAIHVNRVEFERHLHMAPLPQLKAEHDA